MWTRGTSVSVGNPSSTAPSPSTLIPVAPEQVGGRSATTSLSAQQDELVGSLRDDFEKVRASGRPRIVVLEGPVGLGKTLVVHEFYRALAEAQTGLRYWPTDAFPSPNGASAESLRKARKLLVPLQLDEEENWKPCDEGATIPWMWWGLHCSLSGHGDAITGNDRQLRQHCMALLNRRLAIADGAEAISDLVLMIGGTFLPPVSMLMSFLGSARSLGKVRKAYRKHSSPPAPVGHKAQVDQVLATITRLSSPDLPFVIAIEDAQWADATVRDVVSQLASAKAHVLVICTARSSGRPESGHFTELLHALDEEAAERPDCLRRVTLKPLDMHEIVRIFEAAAPNTNKRTLNALFHKVSHNPLHAQSLLALRSVNGSIGHDGAITLAPDEVAALPTNWSELGDELWGELSTDEQAVVQVAAMQGSVFSERLTDAAARQLDDSCTLTVAQSQIPGWLRRDPAPDDDIVRFVDTLLYDVAREQQHRPKNADQYRVRVMWIERIAELRRGQEHWLQLPENVRACQLRILLDSVLDLRAPGRDLSEELNERAGFPGEAELIGAGDELQGLELAAGRLQLALDAAQRRVELIKRLYKSTSAEYRCVHSAYGDKCRDLGDYERASIVFERQVKAVRGELAKSPADEDLRWELAGCLIDATTPLCDLKRWDEALGVGTEAARVLDELDPESIEIRTLLARGNNAIFIRCLAERSGTQDRLDEAADALEIVSGRAAANARDADMADCLAALGDEPGAAHHRTNALAYEETFEWARQERLLTVTQIESGVASPESLHASVELGIFLRSRDERASADYHLRRAEELLGQQSSGVRDELRAGAYLGLVLHVRGELVEASEKLIRTGEAFRDGRLVTEDLDPAAVAAVAEFLEGSGHGELAACVGVPAKQSLT
jgi:tetratricopeptide (TPR) repeat protein